MTVTVQQALTTAVAAAVAVGRSVSRPRRQQPGQWRPQPFTLNTLFDALASRWSDWFRRSVETTPARRTRDMRVETVKRARRDLIRNGIELEPLWRLVTDASRMRLLYTPELVRTFDGTTRYQIVVNESSPLLAALFATFADDRGCRHRISRPRLLLATSRTPKRRVRQQVAAERAYDAVKLGNRSSRALEIQENARLLLNVQTFLADMDDYTHQMEAAQQRAEQHGVDVNASTYRPPIKRGQPIPGNAIIPKAAPIPLPAPPSPPVRFQQMYREWSCRVPPRAKQGKPKKKKTRLSSERDKQLAAAPEHARPQILADIKLYHDLRRRWVLPYAGVAEQVREIVRAGEARGESVTAVLIKSGFTRVINRRWQWDNFWPGEVSGKQNKTGVSENGTRYSTSPRARWFLVESRYGDDPDEFEAEELGGYDVSSSQTQILAVLLGLEKLERIARNLSFKNYLARRAWYVAHAGWLRLPHQRTPNGASEYKAADDARLVAFVKELWMRTLYGSPARTVVYESAQDQKQFGPKWTEADAVAVLQSVPEYAEINKFLSACQTLADRVNDFEGAIFIDPYDGARVRWNSVKRETVPLESELKLWVSAPTRPASDAGAYKDDYAIDREALRKRLAPCLVHMLDAAYSAFVLERLEECNVRDCVALHDCWYVPVGIDFDPAMIAKERAEAEAANRAAALAGSSWRVRSIGKNRPSSAETALRVAMLVAGRDWLLSLGPFYSRLIHYLGDDRDYGQDVHRWRNQWQARVDAERWPVFAAKPSDLSRWHGPAEVVPPI